MALCSLSIAALSLKYGETLLTKKDKYLLAAAVVTIILWQLSKNDLLAIILVCIIDAIAFYFTFKKSYYKALRRETLFLRTLDIPTDQFCSGCEKSKSHHPSLPCFSDYNGGCIRILFTLEKKNYQTINELDRHIYIRE
jgi:hypothetical protein